MFDSGEPLGQHELDALLRQRHATRVAIIGERDSGKTTLLTSIYGCFLKGAFAGHEFAESRTIRGFEKRAFLGRVDSGLNQPDTPHTSLSDGLSYFHLRLRIVGNGRRVDLLLSDRAGEMYRDARRAPSKLLELTELFDADWIVILLDGARVANPVERTGAFHAVRQMLRALTDTHPQHFSNARVVVVTTKIDLINMSQDLLDLVHEFEQNLLATFGTKTAELSCCRIAARDPTGYLEPAHGVSDLLQTWTAPIIIHRGPRELPHGLKSEFDLLLKRTTGSWQL